MTTIDLPLMDAGPYSQSSPRERGGAGISFNPLRTGRAGKAIVCHWRELRGMIANGLNWRSYRECQKPGTTRMPCNLALALPDICIQKQFANLAGILVESR